MHYTANNGARASTGWLRSDGSIARTDFETISRLKLNGQHRPADYTVRVRYGIIVLDVPVHP